MALVLFIVYCLFLFRLMMQLVSYGKDILGAYAAYLIAPVIACGAAVSILLTLSGGIVVLVTALILTLFASVVFARED